MSRSEYMTATVQYGDISGDAAADYSGDMGSLESFAKEHGVDTSKFFPVSISANHGEGDYFSVTILAIDRSLIGDTGVETAAYLERVNFEPPLKTFDLEIRVEAYFRAFKMWNVVLRHKAFKNVRSWKEIV